MKKSLLVLGVAVAALASCTNEEVVNVPESAAIRFNSYAFNTTKAASDITSTNFGKFYVYGGYDATTDLFGGTEVTKTGNTWGYTDLQYWAANKNYKFAAYAPKEVGSPTWSYADGELSITTLNSDMGHQYDLVYAEANKTTAGDITNVGTVDLEFSHLLSKIQLVFVSGDFADNVDLEISDLTISGINTQGAWKGDVVTAATPAVTADFTNATITANGTLNAETDEFYVIPQTLNNVKATFTVTVKDAAGTELAKKEDIEVTLPTTILAWVASNFYVYTATINANNIDDPDDPTQLYPIEFTGAAEDWTEPDMSTDGTVAVPEV